MKHNKRFKGTEFSSNFPIHVSLRCYLWYFKLILNVIEFIFGISKVCKGLQRYSGYEIRVCLKNLVTLLRNKNNKNNLKIPLGYCFILVITSYSLKYIYLWQNSTYILGIDIGTTSVKVCLLNTQTREVVVKNVKVINIESGKR